MPEVWGNPMTTPREQLALIIAWHFAPNDTPYDVADAIIAAGWQPPIPDTLDPATTEN